MSTITTIFGPNDRDGFVTWAGQPSIARCGGVEREKMPAIPATFFSNVAHPAGSDGGGDPGYQTWYTGAPDVTLAAVAFKDAVVNRRYRTMFRFVLRDVSVDRSTVVSGPPPSLSWWPFVTAARLKWFNGDPGPLDADATPANITTSDLEIYVGRGLYTTQGDTGDHTDREAPFGWAKHLSLSSFDLGQLRRTYDNISLLTLESTISWADWATPNRSNKTLTLSASAVASFLKTISTLGDAYIDFAFRVKAEDNTIPGDIVNISREIAAWDPHPPSLEIDFDVSQSGLIVATGGPENTEAVEPHLDPIAQLPSGEVIAASSGGSIIARDAFTEIL